MLARLVSALSIPFLPEPCSKERANALTQPSAAIKHSAATCVILCEGAGHHPLLPLLLPVRSSPHVRTGVWFRAGRHPLPLTVRAD